MNDKLTGHCEIVNSRPDIYGNRYWLFILHLTGGKKISGTLTADNVDHALKILAGNDWEEMRRCFSISRKELKIREFNRVAKTLNDFGCDAQEIADKITEEARQ